MSQPARKPLPSRKPSALEPPDVLGSHDGVVYRRERLAPILRELLHLVEADWRENGIDHEKVPLNLKLDTYLDYDTVGILQIVTARDSTADDILVGFVFAFVHPNIMHDGLGWCLLNLYYLFPEYRGRGVGSEMLKVMLAFLKEADVSVVEASEKIGHTHGAFERLGFKPTDMVLRKYLEK